MTMVLNMATGEIETLESAVPEITPADDLPREEMALGLQEYEWSGTKKERPFHPEITAAVLDELA